MLKFHQINNCPPGSYRGYVPETNFHVKAETWRSLLEKLHAHRVANGIPIKPGWIDEAEDYACQGLGPDVCHETDPRFGWVSGAAMTIQALVAGTTVLGSWIIAGLPKVPQEQADKRSEACVSCMMNLDVHGCQPCALPVFHTLVGKLIGSSRSKHHDQLKACAVCGCSNAVKVWAPLEHIKKSFDYADRLPDNCWLKKEDNAQL